MSRRRQAVMAAVLCAVFSQAAPVFSQSPPPAAPPLPAPPFPGADGQRGIDGAGETKVKHRDNVVRVASDYALRQDDQVDNLVVVMGNARIDGHILGDLVVVLGEAQLGSAAVVDGDLAIIGGTLTVKSGAAIKHDVVV